MKVNGSLAFDASSASEIQNLRVQKYATAAAFPTWTAADAGRMVFAIDTATLYYGTSAAWVPLATGGNAAALQTEVDAIETSLGSIVTASGTFVVGQVTVAGQPSTATTLTGVLNEITAAMAGKDQLSELLDVNVTGVLTGDFLRYNGTSAKWEDHTLVLADVTDVTATVAEVNSALDGITSTAAELNILHGVTGTTAADISSIAGYAAQGVTATEFGFVDATSSIQTQLDNKQALDAGLTALAVFNTNGIIVQTADNVYAGRTLQAPTEGLTITNPAGTAGNPTFALANDLAKVEGLTTSGYVVRDNVTGDWTTHSLSVVSTDLVITGDASGVSTDTTFGLAEVTQATTGDFVKVTLDSKGRVVGNTAVTTGDITALVDTTYVNVGGDTMTGSLVMGGSAKITLPNAPVLATDAANKAYVDALTQGLSWKHAVVAASVGDVTISAPGATIDGVALTAGDRVLLKDQAAAAQNGIYVFNGAAAAMTRAIDMDAAAEFDGSAVFVQQGAVNEGTGWTETATVTAVGTSPVAFSQFSGGQAFIWGVGLSNTGNTVNVNLGAGIAQLPSDEVGLDIVTGKAVQLTGTATGDQLTFVLDGGAASGLEQSSAGLKISALGVTNAMLAHAQFTINGDSGTDSLILGDTLQIKGTAAQGISTVVTESPVGTSTFTLTVADASSSQKGVATFSTADFAVTAGDVTIKAAGVDNAQLANSTITVTGTTGSDAVALGESFAIIGGSTPITTVSAANSVTISVADADTAAKGLASFNSDHFAVTAGAVSLAATLDDLTNVAGADAAGAGDLLTATGTGLDWVPVTRTALAGTIKLGDLQDVGTAPATTIGTALIADGSAWQAKKIFHVETIAVAASSWTVTHNIGQQYCNVTVVDSTDNVVIPQSIVFTSANVVTVTFNTSVAGKLVVMGVAGV
jgi:hypothetical protein